jgi:hypothetical protein
VTFELFAFVCLLVAAPVLRYYLVIAPKKRDEFKRRWDEINGDVPRVLPVEAIKAGIETPWQRSVRQFADGLKDVGKKLGGK